MRGLYILAVLIGMVLILGYLVMKPTNSDLVREYDQIEKNLRTLKMKLSGLQPMLRQLQEQKRRTFKLDKENDQFREKVNQLTLKFNRVSHSLENITEDTREAATQTLQELNTDIDQAFFGMGTFEGKVNAMHEFVTEGYPLIGRMENLQRRLNQLVADRERRQNNFNADKLREIESLNQSCRDIDSQFKLAIKAIHSQLDQGQIMARTVINELNNLIPTFEAFLKDLEESS